MKKKICKSKSLANKNKILLKNWQENSEAEKNADAKKNSRNLKNAES